MRNPGLLCIAMLLGVVQAFSQNVINDPTFNASDVGRGQGDAANNTIHSLSMQADGKVIIGGTQNIYNGVPFGSLRRVNTDGTLDITFNTGGESITGAVYTTLVQTDGKILAGGAFTAYNGINCTRILRLNTDGSVDASFNPGTGPDNSVLSMALQSDGKIIIAGDFTTYNGTTATRVARLNTNGSLDAGFVTGTGANGTINKVLVQPDGKVLAGGNFTNYNSTSINRLMRLNTDGSIDAGFAIGTGVNGVVWSLDLQSDNKILVAGTYTLINGSGKNRIARLHTDGSVDATFAVGSSGVDGQVALVKVLSTNKIILGGIFTVYNLTSAINIVGLNADGSYDSGFNAGTGTNNAVLAALEQTDEDIVIAGVFSTYNQVGRNYITRINSDGTLDETYNTNTGADNDIYSMATQTDDKLIITGLFKNYNGKSRNGVARLNSDGTLDQSFDPGTGANDDVNDCVLQSDGKIIIVGDFTSYNGTSVNRIVRLNADGSIDGSFTPGTGVSHAVNAVALQSDGKIVIAGMFTSYNGTSRNRIARLNADGTIDTGFNPGTGANATVHDVALQSDGKIIIGGAFTSYNGTARNRIARLAADGTLDAAFTIGTGLNGDPYAIALQTDGKILAGGAFTNYGGTSRRSIVRINTDGTLDATFTVGAGASGTVNDIALQSDGKIIIGGAFDKYNNINTDFLARINTNGSIDNTFLTSEGANAALYAIALQSGDKIVVAGSFNAYHAAGRNRIARVVSGTCTPPTLSGTSNVSHCGPASMVLSASASSGVVNWYTMADVLIITGNTFTTPVLAASKSYKVEAFDGCASAKTFVTVSIDNYTIDNTTSIAGTTITATQAGGATYLWLDCNNSFASLSVTTQNYTPSVDGNYAVAITMGSCKDTSDCVPMIVTSQREEDEAKEGIHVYPNPGSGVFALETDLPAEQITVTNEYGKTVLRQTSGSYSATINLEQQPSGIYFVSVKYQNTMRTLKLVKQ